jgi:hypothetical protein
MLGEINARIARGEPVAPSDYYLQTAAFFETSTRLNKIVSIAVGEQPDGPDGMKLDFPQPLDTKCLRASN